MGRYFIKQKVFSWRNRFTVKNAKEQDVYYVEGEAFSWGHKLSLLDINGREKVYIEQKLMTWMPEYHLYIGQNLRATIKQRFAFFKSKFDFIGPNWEIEGDFWGHDYVIRDRGKIVADISKVWFTWGDSYEIDIFDKKQEELLLAAVIVLDCVLADEAAANSNNY